MLLFSVRFNFIILLVLIYSNGYVNAQDTPWTGCHDPTLDCSNKGSCELINTNASCVCSFGFFTTDTSITPQCDYQEIYQTTAFLYAILIPFSFFGLADYYTKFYAAAWAKAAIGTFSITGILLVIVVWYGYKCIRFVCCFDPTRFKPGNEQKEEDVADVDNADRENNKAKNGVLSKNNKSLKTEVSECKTKTLWSEETGHPPLKNNIAKKQSASGRTKRSKSMVPNKTIVSPREDNIELKQVSDVSNASDIAVDIHSITPNQNGAVTLTRKKKTTHPPGGAITLRQVQQAHVHVKQPVGKQPVGKPSQFRKIKRRQTKMNDLDDGDDDDDNQKQYDRRLLARWFLWVYTLSIMGVFVDITWCIVDAFYWLFKSSPLDGLGYPMIPLH